MSQFPLEIETERFLLRPLTEQDIDLCLSLFTDEAVARFIGGVMTEPNIKAQFPIWCRRGNYGALGVWSIADKATGEKSGTGALLPLPVDADDTEWHLLQSDRLPDRDVEIGYILKQDAWGRGIATEVCRALLRFAFDVGALEKVVACTDPANEASQNVLRKSGLRDVGPIRAYSEDGVPGFEITREAWQA